MLIQPGGQYARMVRVAPRQLLCAFSWKRAAWVRTSRDEGRTWDAPVKVAEWEKGTLTNTELLVRKNGEVLCLFNRRPPKTAGNDARYGIAFSRSRDAGRTWSAAMTIYEAGSEFRDGCWEPAAIELPDGAIQIYFANEGPYTRSDEQEISTLRSTDGGATWQPSVKVSFRAGHRDGMPVPVLTHDGKRAFMAIEDNGLSGTFKPVIIGLPPADQKNGFVDAASERRWSALAKPLPAAVYAGAPYLREIPGNSFALSFQLSEDGDMKHSRMAVCLGDGECRNFGEPDFPFPSTPAHSFGIRSS